MAKILKLVHPFMAFRNRSGVPFVFKPGIAAAAFLFSGTVGVVFGYFPARKAALMDPIEALRYE